METGQINLALTAISALVIVSKLLFTFLKKIKTSKCGACSCVMQKTEEKSENEVSV